MLVNQVMEDDTRTEVLHLVGNSNRFLNRYFPFVPRGARNNVRQAIHGLVLPAFTHQPTMPALYSSTRQDLRDTSRPER
ncbi:hypothetical protein [Paraburkholderia sediminicola]|uniref:hypothetical protein n=1 Tax=Paraburkholderia sediminicola TaxID=458836 RepID=UPI0038BB7156